MMQMKSIATGIMAAFFGAAAQAQVADPTGLEVVGKPDPDATGFQPAVTSLMQDIVWLDNMVHGIMAAITVFVTLLLIWVIVRFNHRANPEPAFSGGCAFRTGSGGQAGLRRCAKKAKNEDRAPHGARLPQKTPDRQAPVVRPSISSAFLISRLAANFITYNPKAGF